MAGGIESKHGATNKNTGHTFQEGEITRFGDRLHSLMNGLSFKAFAKKCDMSDKAIRDYVSGKTFPSLDKIEHISKVTGCSFVWLATGVADSSYKQEIYQMKEEQAEYVVKRDKQPISSEVSKIEEITFSLKRLSDEEQERIINQIVNSGVKSLVPNEISQRALAISNLILTLSDEDQREILLLIESKKLDTLLNNKQKNRMAG